MSNHARGLWGYTGGAGGGELTIQATGMGGPSAAIVLGDLAELGVRRAVRIGTCAALDPRLGAGELLLVAEARAEGGSGASFGVSPGGAARPDAGLSAALAEELGDAANTAAVASFDAMPAAGVAAPPGVAAADLQTVAVLARAEALGIAAAALLIVAEGGDGGRLPDAELERAAKRAGTAVRGILSS
jgi:purine-nucleoside phosphorylase